MKVPFTIKSFIMNACERLNLIRFFASAFKKVKGNSENTIPYKFAILYALYLGLQFNAR